MAASFSLPPADHLASAKFDPEYFAEAADRWMELPTIRDLRFRATREQVGVESYCLLAT